MRNKTTSKKAVVFTNKAKCRDCYRCVRVCPVKAIKMEKGQAFVLPENCIACGTCINECPQKAKSYRTDVEKVLGFIDAGFDMAVSVAPSFASIYSAWEYKRIASALRKLGFMYVSETAVGAYEVAFKTKELIEENPNITHIATACPAVVNFIEKYYSEFVRYLTPIVSPMMAHAQMLKTKLGKKTKVIFVGPCVAKKDEADREVHKKNIDAVLTFEELEELFKIKNIELSKCEESSFNENPGGHSRLFPLEGGMLKTANLDTNVLSNNVLPVSGFDELQDVLDAMKNSSEPYVIEPLFCSQGCINGPAIPKKKSRFQQRIDILEYDKQNPGIENAEIEQSENLIYQYKKQKIHTKTFSENEIKEVLKETGKLSKEDELNCGACGYSSCREKAIAVLEGLAEVEMCMPYMRKIAEQKNDLLIKTDPNGIVILNEKLEILHINPAFKNMFSCSDAICGKKISYLIDPDPFEKLLTGEVEQVRKTVEYKSYNLICHQIHYIIKEENQYIGIFIDVTDQHQDKEKLKNIKAETIIQAQELIEHQINMAQTLARFLGDNTAKGEILLNRLIDAIGDK